MSPAFFYFPFSHSTSKSTDMFYLTISHRAWTAYLFYLTTSIYLSFSLSFLFSPQPNTDKSPPVGRWGGRRACVHRRSCVAVILLVKTSRKVKGQGALQGKGCLKMSWQQPLEEGEENQSALRVNEIELDQKRLYKCV